MVAAAAVRAGGARIAAPDGITLQVAEVSHGFLLDDRPLPVLDRVSLRVAPGELVALLGPSGCGKSTLLRLAAGLEAPLAGTVLADGAPVAGPDPSRGLVFQDPTLYPWRTVRANAAFGLEAQGRLKRPRDPRVEEVLRLVGLADFASALPHQLSGGMAQRAALARALVNEPRLLLMDEPLGKLDSLTRLAMQAELVALWQARGFTGVLVTHDVEEALFMAQRVVVLSQRPAQVVAEVANELPYPRHRGDPRLAVLRREVLASLGLDASW